jgi:hypothetical protein
MKIYRWYSEALDCGGVTAAYHSATTEIVIAEVEMYIDNTFKNAQLVDDLLISVWPIEEDDDFNELCPNTIAVSY